jgi:hypothetical protein
LSRFLGRGDVEGLAAVGYGEKTNPLSDELRPAVLGAVPVAKAMSALHESERPGIESRQKGRGR